MLRFIFRRLLSAVITIWFIATATFVAMHAVPGDPLQSDKEVSAEIRENLEAKYGLDKPLYVQYGRFIGNLLRGDLGISFTQKNRQVNDIIREHFPVSASLGLLALFFAVLGGVLFGALASTFQNRWPDSLIMLTVILGVSVPGFVFAILAQLGIVKLNAWAGFSVLPVAGWQEPGIVKMLVPSMMLGLGTMAYLTRLMRTSLLEVANADFIRTAKAKGLSRSRIFFRHQMRNALLPMLSMLGPTIAGITTGGFVVELVFAIPGLGRFFVEAVQQLDYTVIMGTTVFYGAFLVLMVMLVDVLYGLVDPRIRISRGG